LEGKSMTKFSTYEMKILADALLEAYNVDRECPYDKVLFGPWETITYDLGVKDGFFVYFMGKGKIRRVTSWEAKACKGMIEKRKAHD
jgi:hypothetical protein